MESGRASVEVERYVEEELKLVAELIVGEFVSETGGANIIFDVVAAASAGGGSFMLYSARGMLSYSTNSRIEKITCYP